MAKARSPSLLETAFGAVVAAAHPANFLAALLPPPASGRTLVLAAGKGARLMAQEFTTAWPHSFTGLAALPADQAQQSLAGFELLPGAHPLPDQGSLAAGRRFAEAAACLTAADQAILLLSGGASALLSLPPPGISLTAKRSLCAQLLTAGASIGELNCVRRHLSALKGGRLAALAYPAKILTLAVSDVPGDEPVDIASGPTVGDRSPATAASQVLARWHIAPPASIAQHLADPANAALSFDDVRLRRAKFVLAATPSRALAAAAQSLTSGGYRVINLGSCISGEAREAAAVIAGIARAIVQEEVPAKAPVALLSGGELTVSSSSTRGRGGPNTEFALAAALMLADLPNVQVLACDSDGKDGAAEAAGAIINSSVLASPQLREAALAALANHDSASLLASLGVLHKSGPTGINVNDLRIILIDQD